jgi:ubiquinone/menaquinone biosynthesis C-methylase UbiE
MIRSAKLLPGVLLTLALTASLLWADAAPSTADVAQSTGQISQSTADVAQSTRVTDPQQYAKSGSGGYAYRQQADYVLKELDLRPGDVVVDIGAGDGWWAEKMAAAVGPQGAVHAAEIDQRQVDRMKQRFASLPQVKPYLCKTDSLELPDDSCDLAFLSQTYHHLKKDTRVEYLRHLRKVVKPTGRLVVVENYSELLGSGKDHATQLSTLLGEAEQAGWIAVRCQLIRDSSAYIAIFVQKDLFAKPAPPAKKSPPAEPKTEKPSK